MTSQPMWCRNTLVRIVSDLANYADGRRIPLDLLDAFEVQLELVYRELAAMELVGSLTGQAVNCLQFVREALAMVQNVLGSEDVSSGYQAPIDSDSRVPKVAKRFTIPRISKIVQVSVRTIRRRMTEYDLSVRECYSNLTDEQLDGIVRDIQVHFPTCGNRQMQGHLYTRGVRVQQQRVRESQRRVDPVSSVMRRLRTITRREYHVNGPGALWHIDGNHKLIRLVNYYIPPIFL